MWLLGRLVPDYKSIAEFRRMHREAVAEAGAELVRFARSVGLVHGEWVAIELTPGYILINQKARRITGRSKVVGKHK